MAEIVVKIPEELRQEMEDFPDIEWQVVVRKMLKEEVERMRELKKIVSRSKLTEKDVRKLSAKVDEALERRFRESLKK